MRRQPLTRFLDRHGVWREPDARATAKQLLWLNAHGMLDVVVHPHQFEPIAKAEAAHAIADTVARDPVERIA